MLNAKSAFSGFAVRDLDAARTFYRDTLGLDVTDGEMGNLNLRLPGGGSVFIYPKDDHMPAGFTILNFAVDNVDKAVDELANAGVKMERYDTPGFETDEKGVYRGQGPAIAWFTDPSGNILSVLEGDSSS
jgi:catechol 2,3-dioxygenase-like lactoylglutathione lyase family enzyme